MFPTIVLPSGDDEQYDNEERQSRKEEGRTFPNIVVSRDGEENEMYPKDWPPQGYLKITEGKEVISFQLAMLFRSFHKRSVLVIYKFSSVLFTVNFFILHITVKL